VTPHWIPEQSASHNGLLDLSHQPSGRAQFDAIVVPTNRRVKSLRACIGLALRTSIPLIVVCSKRVDKDEVIQAAKRKNVKVFALNLPPHPANPLEGISFATSTDEGLLALTSGRTRDLSMKRNLGLVIAQMLGWQRLMFLDDDIYGVSKENVYALAAGLNDHNVSVLIPNQYPDNSVACHAYRLGGGEQDKFASAGGMGVRCDREDLAFFPNIYNEDWFFFSEEAASQKIAQVGMSRQRKYDPYADPQRAVKEEFGDLLAEGLYARLDYARLDAHRDVPRVDVAYWTDFIQSRRDFLKRVAESLTRKLDGNLNRKKVREVRAALISIGEARLQLERIDPELCQKFINLWQADLAEWRRYLTKLPHLETIESALKYLGTDYAPKTR